jgi:hypothetical protein
MNGTFSREPRKLPLAASCQWHTARARQRLAVKRGMTPTQFRPLPTAAPIPSRDGDGLPAARPGRSHPPLQV